MKRLMLAGTILMAVTAGFASPAAAWTDDFHLFVKVKGIETYYSYDELVELTTRQRESMRGIKTANTIGLPELVTAGGNIEVEEIEGILLVGGTRILLLENDLLQYLPHLELKLGRLRPSIAPTDDETWHAMQPEFGAPRFKDVQQVFVYATGELHRKGDGKGGGHGTGPASGGGGGGRQGEPKDPGSDDEDGDSR